MFKLPDTFKSAKQLSTLFSELAWIRRYRQARHEQIPFRTRIAYFRNILRHRTHEHWPGAYVLTEQGDYFFVPNKVDVMSGYTLLKPLATEHIIEKFCPTGGVVFDIGANIGHWTVQMAHAVGNSGQVYAFEPIPLVHDALTKTLRINMLRQAQLCNKALSNSNGTSTFSIEDFNSGASKLGEVKQGAQQIDVETMRLDDFCSEQNINHIDFIKIDVEGFESSVLQGARDTLNRLKPALIMETGHEDQSARQQSFDILTEAGYELIGIVFKDGIVEATWDNFIHSQHEFANAGVINILCLPR